jgi:hypothetical protein
MTEWKKLYDKKEVNLGKGFDYKLTIMRKGLKQIELMQEYDYDSETYFEACGMNIGTLTPEIIEDEDVDSFVELIQGDFDLTKEFASYEEALAYAKKYMGEK